MGILNWTGDLLKQVLVRLITFGVIALVIYFLVRRFVF